MRTADPGGCLSQRAFYLLRRTLRDRHPQDGRRLRPSTTLEELIPKEDRRDQWEQLRLDIGATRWPELELTKPAFVTANFLLVVTWLSGEALLIKLLATGLLVAIIGFTVLMAFVAHGVLNRLTLLQTSFGGQTLGTLSEHLVASNPQLLTPSLSEWTTERIRLSVRKIISEQLGIKPDFDDDADFVRDLGVD